MQLNPNLIFEKVAVRQSTASELGNDMTARPPISPAALRETLIRHVMTVFAVLALIAGLAPRDAAAETAKGNYASVDGLRMYYESHGAGAPLVLLHGGLCTIEVCFDKILPSLAKTRRVIAIEQQAHGRTADIDRPLSYDQMAEDTAALLRQLGIEKADFFGYSMGGTTALRIAMRHPNLVRRLVVLAGAHDNDGWDPAILKGMEQLTPESIPPMFQDAYAKVAPDPKRWATLLAKIKGLVRDFEGWRAEDVRAIEAPVLIMLGDRDIVRPEYAVQLLRLLPHGQLAVLPGSDHFAIFAHPDWVLSMSTAFLDASSTK